MAVLVDKRERHGVNAGDRLVIALRAFSFFFVATGDSRRAQFRSQDSSAFPGQAKATHTPSGGRLSGPRTNRTRSPVQGWPLYWQHHSKALLSPVTSVSARKNPLEVPSFPNSVVKFSQQPHIRLTPSEDRAGRP